MASITSKGIDIERKEILQGYGKPPPEGLIPVGNSGIYLSPNVAKNKEVSPFDCEQWPDSPYCGGVPWTRTPIGFDLDFGFDGCGGWVEGIPIVGFTKMPKISAAWRKPGECRNQEQPKVNQPNSTAPSGDKPQFPGNIPPDATVMALFGYYGTLIQAGKIFPNIDWERIDTLNVAFRSMSIPGDIQVGYPGNQPPFSTSLASGYCYVNTSTFYREVRNGETLRVVDAPSEGALTINISPRHKKYINSAGKQYNFQVTNRSGTDPNAITNETINWAQSFVELAYGNYGDIIQVYTNENEVGSLSQTGSGIFRNCKLLNLYVVDWGSRLPKAPPPDYKKRKCECMQCCGSGQAQDRRRDQDNAELLKLLREINRKLGNYPVSVNIFDKDENKPGAQASRVKLNSVSEAQAKHIHETQKVLKCIGIDQLPIYTPSSVIDDESNGILGDLGDLKNNIFKQRIESLAELNLWDIRNKYEIFGKWQEVYEIEDSDPTKKGNQKKKVVLPNMARTFRELMILNATQIKVLGMLFDVSLKMYIDLINTKISTAVSEAILRDIQDYLDYPTEVKNLDVPIGVTIPSDNTPNDDKEDLDRFLRNSVAKAAFDDWTGEGSMTDMLLLLTRMAEGYLGQNFGKI